MSEEGLFKVALPVVHIKAINIKTYESSAEAELRRSRRISRILGRIARAVMAADVNKVRVEFVEDNDSADHKAARRKAARRSIYVDQRARETSILSRQVIRRSGSLRADGRRNSRPRWP